MKTSKNDGSELIILKYVLKNALQFQGKANPKAVLGPILKENPELKQDMPALMRAIDTVVKEVEQLSVTEQSKKLQELAPELLQPAPEDTLEGPLKPLPHAQKGNMVVRIAPSPSGALHIGHAYGASLNYEYSKMYQGKLILRIEDTNPENIYEPAYKLIEENLRWLTDNNVAEVYVQSSRLETYYDYAEKLIQQGKAYVCTCNAEVWREMKNHGKACLCREVPTAEHQLRYAKMFNGYAEGEAVLRLKTDIQNKNPAMRDFGLMRIVEHIHPKTGKEQRLWPLMVFSVAIDDHELGITHVLNGKDQADNAMKERLIMEHLGWKAPEYKHWGMINFEGFVLSTTQTRKAIEQGEYKGWDDIRLPFLPALRKRGYQPGAFRRYALEIGLSLNDKTVSKEEFWKNINAFNKEIVDPIANRYFFLDEPVGIVIENCPQRKVEIELHPDFPSRGKRAFLTEDKFYISMHDFKRLGEGYIHRLMDCCNFELRKNKLYFLSEDYEEYKNSARKGHIIHWLPHAAKNIALEVLQENGIMTAGLGEESVGHLKEGEIVQLERRYFARLIRKEKDKVTFWYLHK